jgi:Flp pilus assembly protein TadD
MPSPSQAESAWARIAAKPAFIALALAALVCTVFHSAARFDYIDLDDPAYVTANPTVLGGLTLANVSWAFRTGQAGNWHPLTWLSHMLDVQLFGAGPAAPHLVNVALHLANSLLLFYILRGMTGMVWRSVLVAALFATHPLHVESVAWIAERKDVFSAFFFMLTLWSYAKRRLIPALIFFTLGLLSKPMLVTTPFVLLLLDFWPLQRFGPNGVSSRSLVLEKIPFFLLAILSCIATVFAQSRGGAVQPLSLCPIGTRLENAVVSCLVYLAKTIWPFDLATPYPDIHPWPFTIVAAGTLLLLGISIGSFVTRLGFPYVFTGWFWFLGMLVPVIGLVQVGAQSMADRYTYLPLIGIFILVVWGSVEVLAKLRLPKTVGVIIAALILCACAARTMDQFHYWRDSESLLTHTIAVSKNNWIAEYNLGWELEHHGKPDEALSHYRAAATIQPNDADSEGNLGFLLGKKKDYAAALPCLEIAARLKPGDSGLQYNLANTLLHLQRYDDAIPHYEIFLQQHPDHVDALNELGVAYSLKGNLDAAIARYRQALHLRPDDANAHYNLGEALALQGRNGEARAELNEALRLRPGWDQPQRELENLNAPAK